MVQPVRIRSVHPEFFSDPKVAELSPTARLLYIGLWCFADDYGHGRYLPKTIEGAVFPREVVDIQRLLWELERRRFIRLYEADGDRFYEVPKWKEWQKPKHYAKTRIPEPETYVSTEDFQLSETFGKSFPESAQGVGVGEGVGAAAGGDDFHRFNLERAEADAAAQKKAGVQVRTVGGLARTIAARSDFLAESEHIWKHRTCETCNDKALIRFDSAGGGTTWTKCTENP